MFSHDNWLRLLICQTACRTRENTSSKVEPGTFIFCTKADVYAED